MSTTEVRPAELTEALPMDVALGVAVIDARDIVEAKRPMTTGEAISLIINVAADARVPVPNLPAPLPGEYDFLKKQRDLAQKIDSGQISSQDKRPLRFIEAKGVLHDFEEAVRNIGHKAVSA